MLDEASQEYNLAVQSKRRPNRHARRAMASVIRKRISRTQRTERIKAARAAARAAGA